MAGFAGTRADAGPDREGEDTVESRRLRVIALVLVVSLMGAASSAFASPLADKKAQAVAAKGRIDALATKVEIATEDYDQAKIKYDRLAARVHTVQRRLRRIDSQQAVLQKSLGTRAESMYRTGPVGILDVLLGSASFQDFATTWDLLNQMNKQDAGTVAKLKGLRSESLIVKTQLDGARASAKKVYDTMSARRSAILSDQRKAQAILRSDQAAIQALEAADNAQATAAARQHGGGSGKGTGWNWGDPPRAPRSGVVSIAMRYLGRPYQWGASGPGSFDCSGFTMFVYAQVGVSLPHSSRAQASSGAFVSRGNLQPGDLVFFGNPIHHVGIYVGGGDMIHSPHTGSTVRVSPLEGGYAGACRP